LVAGFSVALFFFEIFLFATNNGWNNVDWISLLLMTYGVTGVLLIGHSFHYLRKSKSSFRIFLLPVSTFEKFTYELLTKIVLFTVLFFMLFPIISSIATNTLIYVFGYPAIEAFNYSTVEIPRDRYFLKTIFWGLLFGFSLAFAGAAAIKRFPLVKTLVFVGSIAGLVISYIYFIFEKLHLVNGVGYVLEKLIKDQDTAFIWLYSILGISTLTALMYAFFKLKEKEV
jgi:hypothetical protein